MPTWRLASNSIGSPFAESRALSTSASASARTSPPPRQFTSYSGGAGAGAGAVNKSLSGVQRAVRSLGLALASAAPSAAEASLLFGRAVVSANGGP